MLCETYDLPIIESGRPAPSHVRVEGDRVIRRISGAFEGENIRLDGVVIGEVTRSEPEIVCKDGRIVGLHGIEIKQHGLEKFKNRKLDIFTARVKTGNIRRTKQNPKIKRVKPSAMNKIAIIDHCAESTFELVKDAGLVVTVGDDTTTIAADILTRLGIPVIGIIDGDIDGVLDNTVVPEDSVIICVKPGFDDIVGKGVSAKLFGNKQQKVWGKDELLTRILALAEKYIVEVTYY
ncbi:MAG: DUF2117 domain-containing protein [Candidatus Methanoperedens sp.]|nr:DUF2117 domain-containing protein [Candidatus Methanoperedens sp.]